jgi:hypothetical protein
MAVALAAHLGKTAVLVETPMGRSGGLPFWATASISSCPACPLTPARQYKIAFAKPYFKSGSDDIW